MVDFAEYYQARDTVIEILRKDLIGPVTENEVLSESPLSYYVAGKLYPQGMEDTTELDEQGDEVGDLENSYDSPLVLSSQRCQSSMGITFLLKGSSPAIKITAKYATYEPLSEEEAKARGLDEKFLSNTTSARIATYLQRIPYSFEVVWNACEGPKRVNTGKGAFIDIRPCQANGHGCLLMAVSLINKNRAVDEKLENARRAILQSQLTIEVCDSDCQFEPMDSSMPLSSDIELAELEMLYGQACPYAQGHGCAADWDKNCETPRWIRTDFLPLYEVLQMRPRELAGNKSNASNTFSMQHLATASKDQIDAGLSAFICEYESWIDEQETKIALLPEKYHKLAKENIANCRACAQRMRSATKILSNEDLPLQAFRHANEAMLLQRVNSIRAKGIPVDQNKVCWYPFQLGFFLMQIRAFAEPSCDEREIADLLWFPTGGGKTEAYLGVAAYAIFLRRLTGGTGGTTVIMRYTLRLLTLQQFERALALVTACEYIRQRDNIAGDPITIGMYVGSALTPNTLEEAAKLVKSVQDGEPIREGMADPFQIRKCPWCGETISPENYVADNAHSKMRAHCPNEDCAFHEEIPAAVVDEDIYSNLPTFIVATVDKFAQLPLKEEAARILGIGTDNACPSLIIQDELHLISGPLGTMVGAYETAIDILCGQKSVTPKIITSTATAKSSKSQLLSLYGKDSFQFPPQAIDMRDSFFAIEATREEKPARIYLGIMGSDAAITTVATRTAAALLFATRYLEVKGYSEEVVDSYWTLVEYFNTLRELGGSLTSLQDSVQNLFSFLASTKFKDIYPGVNPDERYGHVMELTSRRSSAEITRAFQDLEEKHGVGKKGDAIDFVMATNMLSVGVDVGRLNSMVVYGQPKVNSEYIQATSRVGRSTPGLVVSLLNPKRSRDRSHYEQFIGFHQALYKHVESSTLTPFSDRARDRSLHTIFVTLCRYTLPNMSENRAADSFRASMDGVKEIKTLIVEYVKKTEPEEADAVAQELDLIAEEWEEKTGCELTYYTPHKPNSSLFKSELEDDRFRVMNSMRSVEPSANLFEGR